MLKDVIKMAQEVCRSPHGERGLKLNACPGTQLDYRRSPHGERGLKCACG